LCVIICYVVSVKTIPVFVVYIIFLRNQLLLLLLNLNNNSIHNLYYTYTILYTKVYTFLLSKVLNHTYYILSHINKFYKGLHFDLINLGILNLYSFLGFLYIIYLYIVTDFYVFQYSLHYKDQYFHIGRRVLLIFKA